jgi:hypothetical protein
MRPNLALVAVASCIACGVAPREDSSFWPREGAGLHFQPIGGAESRFGDPVLVGGEAAPRVPLARAHFASVEVGGTPLADTGVAIAFAPDGGRLLHLNFFDPAIALAIPRAYVERRSPDGTLLWARQWDGGVLTSVVNAEGETFHWGYSIGRHGSWLLKLTSDGASAWVHEVPPDSMVRLAPGPNGDVLALFAPINVNGVELPPTLLRVAADGAISLIRDRPFGSACRTVSVAWNGGDRVAVLCGTYGDPEQENSVRMFDAGFVERWASSLPARPATVATIAMTPDGGVAVARAEELSMIGREGQPEWSRALDGAGGAQVATDPAGRVAVATAAQIAVLDRRGVLLREVRLPVEPATAVTPLSIAFDPGGGVSVAGVFRELNYRGQPIAPAGGTDVFVVELGATEGSDAPANGP